jgi:hypothetical protein
MGALSGEQTVGVIAIVVTVGGGLVFAAIAVIAYYWQIVRVAEQNAVLKKTMIDKGFSPEDIERVVMAGDPQAISHKIAESVL